MDKQAIIQEYLGKYTKGGKPVTDLSRFKRLMNELGNPQDSLDFVHIAGTNGKGSIVRMVSYSLISAGYKVGEFTSPYIKEYNDRIRFNGINIPTDELYSIMIEQVKPMVESIPDEYSQFEISTATAFLYFAKMKCDIVVLEVGLGGMLDCTNIIKSPLCCVIASLSLDHTAVLGDTIEQIAAQKAGIIKPQCPVVLSARNPQGAVNVIKRRAYALRCELVIPDLRDVDDMLCLTEGSRFLYKNERYIVTMPGKHQVINACSAIEACEILARRFDKLDITSIFKGISYADMPHRCEVINKEPLTIQDGAHNPDGMKALSEYIKIIDKAKKVLICGMSEDKDYKKALGYISPLIDKAYCVDGFAARTVDAKKLCECFSNAECVSIQNAYAKAKEEIGDDGVIIIAGSLYLKL